MCIQHPRFAALTVCGFNPDHVNEEHKLVRGFLPSLTHSAHHVADPRMAAILAEHLGRERAAVENAVLEEAAQAWGKSKAEPA